MTSRQGALGEDASLSAVLAGLVSTLIAYAGPLVIVFQAARGLDPALLESWVWTISIGSGVLGIALSLKYRVPVVIAWSAPGSALLITLLPTVDFSEAVGAYLIASVTLFIIGVTGTFDRIVEKLPVGISAAMLAGILFGFAAKTFVALPAQPLLVGTMFIAFFVGRRWFPRYAVVAVLMVGSLVAMLGGDFAGSMPSIRFTTPTWTTPHFSWQAAGSIGLPLVVVALTGQWVPGIAVLRGSGYARPRARSLIAWTSAGSALLAPFGCHGLNLAAITAAICAGREAHEDPARRYIAGVSGGVLYLILGCLSATVLALFALLPRELVAALAGLALFPTIAGALSVAMAEAGDRDAALVTFIVSASGMSLLGLGAAFWGLLFGLSTHILLRWTLVRRVRAAET
ncbi:MULTISPECIES: benzoate/H(+) symporter BenE family transporter [Alphaproteobacteria]|uniref:Benzoate transporter n=2 Tax=Alphaproteobacteria TaxID=28211 RepID=A0A512HNU4_9HYPH|nr:MULTISPECIES: benzoate/H(+) symporter BenE family transporter [Alphaproteobacteria]GEO87125.1 benzoate transporter [Ciceribacter naphthalenivorans]GLR22663.1 benzoate transporter [Ciceribacter naphthalenivorans]GLT05519.1 benzoate transporter [Sphingomonas psychrolutea]